jgi:ketosteroid isomerase-like protein
MTKLSSLLIVVAFVTLVGAQTKPAKTEQEVRAVELARFEAQLKGDLDKVKLFLADELKYTHSTGKTETKEEFLKALASGLKYLSIEPSQLDIHVYGQTSVITGQASIKIESGGQQLSFKIKYTDVYTLRDGRWQMVAWQSTRLPD